MTDKLHCPYCGEELSNDFGVIFCYNEACKIHGCELNEQVIRDIIDGKKAQDALKGIEIRVAAIRSCVQDGYTQLGETNRNIFIALELFKDLTKEITSITKREE